MDDERKCVRQKLSERASFRVDSCDCGAIHLTIGFITIRLDARAFHEFAAAVQEASLSRQKVERPVIH
jgi:hypothetical protein